MGQIVSRLDRVLADRKMQLKELADRVGISCVNLSKLKTGKVCAIRFSTLAAICEVLDCQPGDILEYTDGEAPAFDTLPDREGELS
jgi:putative transcriptional regulator